MILRLATSARLRIALAASRTVYMQPPNLGTPPIVLLGRTAFVAAWARCFDVQQSLLARQNEPSWRKDRKFHYAEAAFRMSSSSPVPVGGLGFLPNGLCGGALSLVDGVTRTLWLLANGALVLPFSCDEGDADQVDALAGASDQVVRDRIDVLHAP